MRPTKILSAALLGCPLAVSAAGTLGFAVGNTNPDNSCKTQQQYETDLDALADVTKVVRTYTSDGCDTAINIIPACKAKGFQVVLGVWSVAMIYYSFLVALTITQARHRRVLRGRQSSPSSFGPRQRGDYLCYHSWIGIVVPWQFHRR